MIRSKILICLTVLIVAKEESDRRFIHNTVTTRIYNVLEKINIVFKGLFLTKIIHGETGFFLFVDQLPNYLRP